MGSPTGNYGGSKATIAIDSRAFVFIAPLRCAITVRNNDHESFYFLLLSAFLIRKVAKGKKQPEPELGQPKNLTS